MINKRKGGKHKPGAANIKFLVHKDLEFGGQAAVVLRAVSIYPVTSTPCSLLRVGSVDGEEEQQNLEISRMDACSTHVAVSVVREAKYIMLCLRLLVQSDSLLY